jgi:hypothetical protein
MPKSRKYLLPPLVTPSPPLNVWKTCNNCKSYFGFQFIQRHRHISGFHLDGHTGDITLLYNNHYLCGRCHKKMIKEDEEYEEIIGENL